MVKDRGAGSVWSFSKEMLGREVCPNVTTFNILLNSLCMEGKLKKAGYLLTKMEESKCVPTIVTYNTLLN
jgi:leucine-rich PPR motif-containing protein